MGFAELTSPPAGRGWKACPPRGCMIPVASWWPGSEAARTHDLPITSRMLGVDLEGTRRT
jgi:hypothetical protein